MKQSLGGIQAFAIPAFNTTTATGVTLMQEAIFSVHYGVGFMVTYTARPDYFATARPAFEEIRETWQFAA